MQLEHDPARLRLVLFQTLVRLLDAVHDRVAQHVLERRQHALEHLPVQLSRGALHD